STEFILSDIQIRIICLVIGSFCFVLNILCLYLIIKLRRIFSSTIHIVTFLQQVLYIAQNILFNFLFIPFVYPGYGGGYCIGWVCKTHIAPYYSSYMFLTCGICGLFVLLFFFRHQRLIPVESPFKLSNQTTKVSSIFLFLGINIVPIHYTLNSAQMDSTHRQALLKELCPTCDWIECERNFGILTAQSSEVSTI
ncbi:hypothetical protein PENTCL1PPCAC_16641, partial [Pristionchus entomophagus]